MKRNGQAGATGANATGFLARLRRDARGGAAVMLAMMVIPLLLFAGSAVDVTRVYTVKARLQQACDAGALAGRRTMTDTSSLTPLDSTAVAQANAFFNNNFHIGWMQTAAVPIAGQPAGTVFVPSKTSEAQVAGTATLKVPMALMKMFGFQPVTLNVTCEARYDVADADIMFVLDQTGSMACQTSDSSSTCDSYVGSNYLKNSDGSYSITEKSSSRISGLRSAVLNFFDTVTGQADPSTNFRFGFVPYNAVANVGKLLQPLGYVKTSADYQSRDLPLSNPNYDANSGSAYNVTDLGKNQTQCNAIAGSTRSPSTPRTYNTGGGAVVTTTAWNSSQGKCFRSDQAVVPNWTYHSVNYSTAQFITGAAVDNPAIADGTTSTWTGCVEERSDLSSDNQTSFSMTSPPKDLDPDSAPASASDGWAPWWYDVEFVKKSTGEISSDQTRTVYGRYLPGTSTWYESSALVYNEVACPLAAKRLTQTTLPGNSSASFKAAVRTSIQTYLSASNGFRPYGTTYHDVGMTWGTRLLSPMGMFANDTAAWPGHNPPNRFIIFLTDGDMESDPGSDGLVYSEYGLEKYDSRVANGATGQTLDDYHNARFLAACQLAKNRNIKIFVIGYAQSLTTQLTTCASPGQAYYAIDQASLNTAFTSIAKQVAMLRISK